VILTIRAMKYLVMTILGFGILTACTYRPKEKRLSNFNSNLQILESFYKKDNGTIAFKRVLSSGMSLKIQAGDIFVDKFALTHQKFTSVDLFEYSDVILDSLRKQFTNEGFVEKTQEGRDVMFIQIIPDSAMSSTDALGFLNFRQEIEDKIDRRLQADNLGEWFAGDMGAGGNMLFFVNDWEKSTETVMEVLKDQELLDHVLIAKRIFATEDDWSYEIVYPAEYEGIFNQM
jgi:hypothetical protein